MRRAWKISVMGVIAAGAVFSAISVTDDIDARKNLEFFWEMRHFDNLAVVALARGSIYPGMPSHELVRLAPPVWSDTIGRYAVYGFTPSGSYDYVAVIAVDEKVTEAYAGSCTWHWTFFDGTPREIRKSVSTIRHLKRSLRWLEERPALEQSERYKSVMKTVLQQERAKLGVPLESAQTGQSPVP